MASEPQGSTVSSLPHPGLELQAHDTMSGFLWGFWESNSGSHGFKARSLLTEPSLQSPAFRLSNYSFPWKAQLLENRVSDISGFESQLQ